MDKTILANQARFDDDDLDGSPAILAYARELTIAARGYLTASWRRCDDDQLIEEGGGYDMWLGRLLSVLESANRKWP